MKNPIGWFEIYVNDMERAKNFYQSIFDITLEKLGDPTGSNVNMWSFPADFEQYGASGALVKVDDIPAGGNSTLVYFSCEDCAVEEARIENAGGKVQRSKMSLGEYGFCTLAVDTEGNMFGLHSEK